MTNLGRPPVDLMTLIERRDAERHARAVCLLVGKHKSARAHQWGIDNLGYEINQRRKNLKGSRQ